jgi:hypothetical protein
MQHLGTKPILIQTFAELGATDQNTEYVCSKYPVAAPGCHVAVQGVQ